MHILSICRRLTHSLSAVLALISAVCLFAPGSASAVVVELDLKVQPRINAGMMYYEAELDPRFAVLGTGGQNVSCCVSEFGVNDFMPFIGGGATLFVNRFFVDVYAQRAFSGDDETTMDFLLLEEPSVARQTLDEEWKREEYSVSFGYAITDSFSLFAGYRLSDTEFDELGVDKEFALNSVEPIGIFSFFTKLDTENDGPFVGGRYNVRIGDIGTLGLNLGVALVESEFTQSFPNEEGAPSATLFGDTVGTTLGLSWTAPFLGFEGFNYTVGLDGYQYAFEADEEKRPDASETVIRASAGVSYLFE